MTTLLQIVTVILFTVYTLLLEYTEISYLVLTPTFIALTAWTLIRFRPASLVSILCTALGVTGGIYVVFGLCLGVIFP